jgi:uncharacterized protein YeaO (DUF488 family)
MVRERYCEEFHKSVAMNERRFKFPVRLKRVYDPISEEDGARLLVDRLWPRGVTKAAAQISEWLKDLAPSHELRRQYKHDPEHWDEFKQRYFAELAAAPDALRALLDHMQKGPVSLVYAARNREYNNAAALLAYLEETFNSDTPAG